MYYLYNYLILCFLLTAVNVSSSSFSTLPFPSYLLSHLLQKRKITKGNDTTGSSPIKIQRTGLDWTSRNCVTITMSRLGREGLSGKAARSVHLDWKMSFCGRKRGGRESDNEDVDAVLK